VDAGRVLALDVGKKRIGLAISDAARIASQPLDILVIRSSLGVAARNLIQLIEEKSVNCVVIGDPLELDGSRGKQALFTKHFVDILIRNATDKFGEFKKVSDTCFEARDITLVLYDERFTSQGAAQILSGSSLKDEKWREAKDKVSASLILEGFLASNSK